MPGVYKWLWLECIRNTDELPNVSLVKVRQESNGLGISCMSEGGLNFC